MDIQTVTGPVDPVSIYGPVLTHEHLAIDLRTETDRAGYLDHNAEVAAELSDARANYGLALVVDQTARGMGRNVSALKDIADKSEVLVVASTGWYYDRFHPADEPGTSVEQATALLLADLTTGVPASDGSLIRAGVIGEVGTHDLSPSPAERVSLLAAAEAAKATGRPVSTHAHLGTGAWAQVELLASTGLDMQRVSIGHQDLIDDSHQHQFIASSGAYVAFDTIGKESYQRDKIRLRLILALIEAGYASHILLSNDISRHGYLVSSGGTGYGYALGPFATELVAAGVDEQTLDLLYRRNPLRWLSGTEILK